MRKTSCHRLSYSIFIVTILCITIIQFIDVRVSQPKQNDRVSIHKQNADRDVDAVAELHWSHFLQNECKYPVLPSTEFDIVDYSKQTRRLTCTKMMQEFSTFDYRTSTLYIHHDAQDRKHPKLMCVAREVAGTLRPETSNVKFVGEWIKLDFPFDQYVVTADNICVVCYLPDDQHAIEKKNILKKDSESNYHELFKVYAVYKKIYSQILDKRNNTLKAENSREYMESEKLSIDIIGLDSTSYSQFQRHAFNSWQYMKETMGFEHLEMYNKIMDNSAVNIMPILTGLRLKDNLIYTHENKSYIEFASDIDYVSEPIDLDSQPYIWKFMPGAQTLWNDDIMNFQMGVFHYPLNELAGWKYKPTNHYLRPYHVFNYKYIYDSEKNWHCLNTEPYFQRQLDITRQFMETYRDQYHFSFTFSTESTHDNSEYLSYYDHMLFDFLKRVYETGRLNRTALVIFGDHGQRVNRIRSTQTGRIEERQPFFAIYLPDWWKRRHPDWIANYRFNAKRLVSNFDIHKTLMDIVFEGREDDYQSKNGNKGYSLFRTRISRNRQCRDAGIGMQYCTCQRHRRSINSDKRSAIVSKVKAYVKEQCGNVTINLLNITAYEPTQLVRHGIRTMDKTVPYKLRAIAAMEYLDYEVIFLLFDTEFLTRVRVEQSSNTTHMNIEPVPVKLLKQADDFDTSATTSCDLKTSLVQFCKCLSDHG